MRRKFWTWNGRGLAHPVKILRKTIAYPVYMLLALLLAAVTAFGWGSVQAYYLWDEL